MQELLVLVEQIFSNAKTQEVESAVNDIINIITQEGILKEKEQIQRAYAQGVVNEISIYYTPNAEQYYNETYNQNKS